MPEEKGSGALVYASSVAGAVIVIALLLNLDDGLKQRAKDQTAAFLNISENLLKAYGKMAIRLINKTITQEEREQSVEEQWASVKLAQTQENLD